MQHRLANFTFPAPPPPGPGWQAPGCTEHAGVRGQNGKLARHHQATWSGVTCSPTAPQPEDRTERDTFVLMLERQEVEQMDLSIYQHLLCAR